jgi:hypothetical protein
MQVCVYVCAPFHIKTNNTHRGDDSLVARGLGEIVRVELDVDDRQANIARHLQAQGRQPRLRQRDGNRPRAAPGVGHLLQRVRDLPDKLLHVAHELGTNRIRHLLLRCHTHTISSTLSIFAPARPPHALISVAAPCAPDGACETAPVAGTAYLTASVLRSARRVIHEREGAKHVRATRPFGVDHGDEDVLQHALEHDERSARKHAKVDGGAAGRGRERK